MTYDDWKMVDALEWAADAIKAQDGGDQSSETGWASDEARAHWMTIRAMIDDMFRRMNEDALQSWCRA